MRTANELYKAHKAIINECKENICKELERIGRDKLWFDDPFPVLVDNSNCISYAYDSGATAEEIASISIDENGKIYYLWTEEENEIDPTDVISSEWLYLWEKVEEECKNIPTAYYTEELYHDRNNNRYIHNVSTDIEESRVEGEQQAKEQLISNYQQFVIDNAPLDYLPIFFLCVRENGQYKRLYAVMSNLLAEGMGYNQTELHNLKKSLKHPVLCVLR
jgi:hypothetical protein